MRKQNDLSLGLLSSEEPQVFFDLNNGQGTFLYNHNIKEVFVIKDGDEGISITEDEESATDIMYQYDSIRVEFPKTSDNIFATLLASKYPTAKESKLINEYQSAVLGLLDNSFKKPYEDYLKDRLSMRSSVEYDCEVSNIPLRYE